MESVEAREGMRVWSGVAGGEGSCSCEESNEDGVGVDGGTGMGLLWLAQGLPIMTVVWDAHTKKKHKSLRPEHKPSLSTSPGVTASPSEYTSKGQ